MPDNPQEAEFRRHLSEMRRAASGLGHDFATEFSDLDRKIERFGKTAARDARDLGADIQTEMGRLARSIDEEVRRFPHRVAEAGTALGTGTVKVAGVARDVVVDVGHRAKEGAKNAFAAAAGVKRTPMKGWTAPETGAEGAPHDEPR